MDSKHYRWLQRGMWIGILTFILLIALVLHSLYALPLVWLLFLSVPILIVVFDDIWEVGEGGAYGGCLAVAAAYLIILLTALGNSEQFSWPLIIAIGGSLLLALLARAGRFCLIGWYSTRYRDSHFRVRVYDEQGASIEEILVSAYYPDGSQREARPELYHVDVALPLADGPIALRIHEPAGLALAAQAAAPASEPIVVESISGRDVVVIERTAPGHFALRLVYKDQAHFSVAVRNRHAGWLAGALVVACYPDGRRYCVRTGPTYGRVNLPLPAGDGAVTLYAAAPQQLAGAGGELQQLADSLVCGEPITRVVVDTADNRRTSVFVDLYHLGDGQFVDEQQFRAWHAQHAGQAAP